MPNKATSSKISVEFLKQNLKKKNKVDDGDFIVESAALKPPGSTTGSITTGGVTSSVPSHPTTSPVVVIPPSSATPVPLSPPVVIAPPNQPIVPLITLPEPIITEFYPRPEYVGEILTIEGRNFGTNLGDNEVIFGDPYNAKGEIISATSSQIKVRIPQGAQAGLITVRVKGSSSKSVSTKSDKEFIPVPHMRPSFDYYEYSKIEVDQLMRFFMFPSANPKVKNGQALMEGYYRGSIQSNFDPTLSPIQWFSGLGILTFETDNSVRNPRLTHVLIANDFNRHARLRGNLVT